MSRPLHGLANYLFCTACAAKPGERSRTKSDKLRSPHSDRLMLAQDLTSEKTSADPKTAALLLTRAENAGWLRPQERAN